MLGDVDLVGEDEFERVRQLTANRRLPATTRRRRRPRLDFALVLRRETNTKDATTTFRVLDDPFDLIAADLGEAQGTPIGPPMVQIVVNENAVALIARSRCNGKAIRFPKPPCGKVS